jgi:hypothetical protein
MSPLVGPRTKKVLGNYLNNGCSAEYTGHLIMVPKGSGETVIVNV